MSGCRLALRLDLKLVERLARAIAQRLACQPALPSPWTTPVHPAARLAAGKELSEKEKQWISIKSVF